MDINITSEIKVKVGDIDVILSIEEAKELLHKLKMALNEPVKIDFPYLPITMPPNPINPERYPGMPTIWYGPNTTGDNTNEK